MVQDTGTGYRREVLCSTEAFEIVSCSWDADGFSPMHDHGSSACYVLVQEGRFHNRLDTGFQSESREFSEGETIVTPVGAHHEARCVSPGGGRTLHVYVPRIDRTATRATRFQTPSIEEARASFSASLGREGFPWGEVRALLDRARQASVSVDSPLFMNQLFSGVSPHAIAGVETEALSRTTLATFEASPAFTAAELEIVERLGELAGWPRGSRDGIGVPGGSAANFMAIHCARHRSNPRAKAEGNGGAAYRVFVSSDAHYSFRKACAALGLGAKAVVPVSVDGRGRMDPRALDQAIETALAAGEVPLLACATAGTTVWGAFDPVREMAAVCAKRGVWLHVDGAWGGPALFSTAHRRLLDGIELADSLAFDAHKLLGAQLTSTFYLSRHAGLLQAANDVGGGDYLFHADEIVMDRGRLSWQCGRSSSAMGFWALWKNLGTSGIGAFVDRLASVRDESVAWIREQPRLQLVRDPEYLNVCVRVLPPTPRSTTEQWSLVVRERLKQTDRAMVNFAADAQGPFLRLILAHPRLQAEHLREILSAALDVA